MLRTFTRRRRYATLVDCIIPDDGDIEIDEAELGYDDDVVDSKVDNLLRLIKEDHDFCSSMFSGGATKADVIRMIKEEKTKNAKGKQKKSVNNTDIDGPSSGVVGGISFTNSDLLQIADMVAFNIMGKMNYLEQKVNDSVAVVGELKDAVNVMDINMGAVVVLQITKMKTDVIDGICSFLNKSVSKEFVHGTFTRDAFQTVGVGGNCSQVGDNGGGDGVEVNGFVDTSVAQPLDQLFSNCIDAIKSTMLCYPPSFSLGLSQKHNGLVGVRTEVDSVVEPIEDVGEDIGEGVICRKSKRQRTIPANLVGDYQCDKRLLHQARETYLTTIGGGSAELYVQKFGQLDDKLKGMVSLSLGGVSVTVKDFADIYGKSKCLLAKVVDILIAHTKKLLLRPGLAVSENGVFFDTKIVSCLGRNYTKFSKL
ncbi:unnamed protein product [Arabis nemorensis]|uniref:Uncharacterized protein n=1 Tax=Arabis nemorensis TaxID=586526 RepID=A0A565BER4_9BRAS|nr:unnamed protein product [Arabis nemorensis]